MGFECNICLDLVQDPVVTFCGHLYCWPCIYRWISFCHVSPENRDQQQPLCPVCKAEVSQETLVPLYGRGQNTSRNDTSPLGLELPQRPNIQAYPAQQLPTSNYNTAGNDIGGIVMHPMVGMLGEMVFARIFGDSQTTSYTYPNSYHSAGSSNPRLSRHMMQTDKSLSRICFFLCCCVVLCLLLF